MTGSPLIVILAGSWQRENKCCPLTWSQLDKMTPGCHRGTRLSHRFVGVKWFSCQIVYYSKYVILNVKHIHRALRCMAFALKISWNEGRLDSLGNFNDWPHNTVGGLKVIHFKCPWLALQNPKDEWTNNIPLISLSAIHRLGICKIMNVILNGYYVSVNAKDFIWVIKDIIFLNYWLLFFVKP